MTSVVASYVIHLKQFHPKGHSRRYPLGSAGGGHQQVIGDG